MKKILYMILVLVCVVSCQNNYPEPEYVVPSYALEDSIAAGWKIMTIEEVKNINNSATPMQITDKFLMKGIVTADDESGNIYKSIYLQDTTAAICGGLAGIYYGFDEIPTYWLESIPHLDKVLSLCEEFEELYDKC